MKATKKISLTKIKSLIKEGAAKEIKKEDVSLKKKLTLLGSSSGTYGVTGAVWINDKTKKLHAIAGRSSLLFYYL